MEVKSMRYAHAEGHVDLCYHDDGIHLITCGSDGDVRVYEDVEDDDPVAHTIGDKVYSVLYKNGKFYASGDDFAIKIYQLDSGMPDGIVTRFTAVVNHMCASTDGQVILAGSSDFSLQLVDVTTSKQKCFEGHEAPVLSVALSPDSQYAVSSSCDGTVKVWSTESQQCLKTIPGLPKTNDFSTAPCLCRMTWAKDGKYLFVPMAKSVKVFESPSWQESFTLEADDLDEMLSIVRVSPCGKFLAASGVKGTFLVWSLAKRKVISRCQHEKRLTVTALSWNPKGKNQLAFGDHIGYIGVIENAVQEVNTAAGKGDKMTAEQLADLFDDNDDDDLVASGGGWEKEGGAGAGPAPEADSDDDDDFLGTAPSSGNRTRRLVDDDASNDALNDGASVSSDLPGQAPPPPQPVTIIQKAETTPLQPPFQPSSSPLHLSHRFMVWNAVGLIIQYNTEEENSINIEFHDTATHHAMHVTNTLGHTMACLSDQAVVLACEGEDDTPSTLVCMHFGSWESNKEWSVAMPEDEQIEAVCIGDDWVAASTDRRLVRLYTLGGVQRQVFSIPGPVVAMASHTNQLMIVYHAGQGLPGDQCLAVRLMYISGKTVLPGHPLPLTAKSTLSWLGFSAEGTPVAMDSAGIVRMLSRGFGHSWTEVANMKTHCKGKSDNYWLVTLHENPQQIRSVLCKGSRYPPTLPRPNLAILPYQLPLCDMASDKGTLEETFLRNSLMSQHLDFWGKQNYEVDESATSRAFLAKQESLMKLFALACKSDREFRAVELCELMPSHTTVQLAIKYASRTRLLQLAQRLNHVAHRKMTEGEGEQEGEEEEEEDFKAVLDAAHNHVATEWARPAGSRRPGRRGEAGEGEGEEVDMEEEGDAAGEPGDQAEEDVTSHRAAGPFLALNSKEKQTTVLKPLLNSQASQKKNPFKISSGNKAATVCRGTSVFDSMDRTKKSNPSKSDSITIKPKQVVLRKGSSQMKIFTSSKDKTDSSKTTIENKKSATGKTGFQLWFDKHREEVKGDLGDVTDAELTLAAAKRYKQLSKEDQQEWAGAAQGTTDVETEETRKRKREGSETGEEKDKDVEKDTVPQAKTAKRDSGKAKMPLSNDTANKLKSFSFSKS